MPYPHQNPARSSPKKKRTKCKAMDSDGQEISSTKKSQAGAVPLSMSQQPPDMDSSLHPQCSGRPGAGTGGRANQLERTGALLGASAQTSKPKGSTSLDMDIPVNPLAPEPVHKGRGSHAKKPPLPYSASEPADLPAATSTKAQGKKVKVTKTADIPPSSMEASAIQPNFHQCEAGTRFGFSQHIVPLGTESDLQALNNPYVTAAREKVATSLPAPIGASVVIGHLPAATTTSAKKYFVPPIHSRSTSAAHQSDCMFYQNLDPTLRSAGDGHIGQKDSGSDTSSKDSDGSTTDDEEDG
ncbi:hypothetical protein BDR05DRAFT_1005494 [Suillus weaverae]|nr:hypothetical protein BDR05DRAFT_1005494 [Suillus weaverae]